MFIVDEEIDVLSQIIMDTFNAGDLEAMMQCYTEDVVFVDKEFGVVTGRDSKLDLLIIRLL